jgi:hypothetical protein
MPTETITAAQRERLRELLEKATPGPWQHSGQNWRNEPDRHNRYIVGNIHESEPDDDEPCTVSTAVAIVCGNETSGQIAPDTADLICELRNVAGPLLDRIEQLEKLLLPLKRKADRLDICQTADDAIVPVAFSAGDCRAARAALEGP